MNRVVWPSAKPRALVPTDDIPLLNFLDRTILARIVTCRVMSDSIGHGLHQDTLLAFHGPASRFAYSRQYGQGIVSIYSDSVQTVSRSTRSDTISSVLIDDRCGNGESRFSLIKYARRTRYFDRTRCMAHRGLSSCPKLRGSRLH